VNRPGDGAATGPAVTVIATVTYAVLLAAAWLWLWLRERDALLTTAAFGERGEPIPSLAAGVAVGLGTGVLFAAAARLPPLARLQRVLAGLLGPLQEGEILWLALLSGVAEEAFFRLALQDALGLWPASLIFAAFHVAPGVSLLWAPLALAMGALFGWMMVAGYGFAAVALAHALFNYLSLRRMQSA
jgi:membrane protease YdiL (CAAX protease family)